MGLITLAGGPGRKVKHPFINVASGDEAEPTFNASLHTRIIQDDFDSYTTFADAVAGGWTSKDGGEDDDGGSNSIIPGLDGSGKAARLRYTGEDHGSGQEVRAWELSLGTTLSAVGDHTTYWTYYYRVRPNGDSGTTFDLDHPNTANKRLIKVKWFELFNSGGGRAQFHTANATCGRVNVPYTGADGGGSLWHFFGTSSEPSGTCSAGQCRPPYMYQDPGNWHRLTFEYRRHSGPGVTDGIARAWHDGALVVAVGEDYVGVDVPDYTAGGTITPPHWCEQADVDNFFTSGYTNVIKFGSVQTAALWAFDIDLDDFDSWYTT